MKTTNGDAASGLAAQTKRTGMLLLVACAAAIGLTSCAPYYGPPAGGYYAAGYGAPYGYGYGYGSPYYGGPYYDGPYGYGGTSIVISGARYHGYRRPYYRNGYYPRTQVQGNTNVTRTGTVTTAPRVSGSRTRTNNPRTQATVPQ